MNTTTKILKAACFACIMLAASITFQASAQEIRGFRVRPSSDSSKKNPANPTQTTSPLKQSPIAARTNPASNQPNLPSTQPGPALQSSAITSQLTDKEPIKKIGVDSLAPAELIDSEHAKNPGPSLPSLAQQTLPSLANTTPEIAESTNAKQTLQDKPATVNTSLTTSNPSPLESNPPSLEKEVTPSTPVRERLSEATDSVTPSEGNQLEPQMPHSTLPAQRQPYQPLANNDSVIPGNSEREDRTGETFNPNAVTSTNPYRNQPNNFQNNTGNFQNNPGNFRSNTGPNFAAQNSMAAQGAYQRQLGSLGPVKMVPSPSARPRDANRDEVAMRPTIAPGWTKGRPRAGGDDPEATRRPRLAAPQQERDESFQRPSLPPNGSPSQTMYQPGRNERQSGTLRYNGQDSNLPNLQGNMNGSVLPGAVLPGAGEVMPSSNNFNNANDRRVTAGLPFVTEGPQPYDAADMVHPANYAQPLNQCVPQGALPPGVPYSYTPPTITPDMNPALYSANNSGWRPLFTLGQENFNVQLGRGMYGQPTVYVPGQPVRNFLRYVSP